MKLPIDKNGIEITPGDTLKVFHFTGARRKKHFMYKFVKEVNNNRLIISHLDLEDKTYSIAMNGNKLEDYEIVQGYGNCNIDFRDRPKPEKI